MTRHLLDHLHVLQDLSRSGNPIVLALDFDGTLAPIAESPASVQLPPAVTEILTELISADRITLAIVSGRGIHDLTHRVPVRNVILAGNHGLEIVAPEWSYTCPEALAFRPEMHAVCSELKAALPQFPGAWVEEKGLTATVHYRQVETEQLLALKRSVRKLVTSRSVPFSLRAGKLAMEIRPRVAWDKGSAVDLMRSRSGFENSTCICFGDDRTDEAMFRRFPDELTVVVGPRAGSAARYHVFGPDDVQTALSFLADSLRSSALRYERMPGRCFAAEAAWGRGA